MLTNLNHTHFLHSYFMDSQIITNDGVCIL